MRVLALALALLVAGCTSAGDAVADGPSPSPNASVTDDDTTAEPDTDTVALADTPAGDVGLWSSTIGLPVIAAVRTSTPLARLDAVAPGDREAVCRQVATELDAIATPQVLTGIAITADAETATLLVGDLRAKGDLLATCVAGGAALEALVAEVAATHAVAVAWLALLDDA